jgi:hypothetical protein
VFACVEGRWYRNAVCDGSKKKLSSLIGEDVEASDATQGTETTMNAVEALPAKFLEQSLWPRTLDELRVFVGWPAKQTVDVSSALNDVVKEISRIMDSLLLVAIEKRNAVEFAATRAAVFSDYVRVLRMTSDLLRVVLRNDRHATERLISQSLSMLEADFKDLGAIRFGVAVNDQAIFTIWTLRKTNRQIWKLLEPEIITASIPETLQDQNAKLNSDFAASSAWAQFHLACLSAAIRLDKAIYPDVLPEIMSGLRSAVNAYSMARQIVDLRLQTAIDESAVTPYSWDEEDAELMASSMQDMASEEM